MPKFNFENALTWTWAFIAVLTVGIYLGMLLEQSEAIKGSFFDFVGALMSLGILAIGYQGLHAWRIQDRSKMKREYAQKTIGHLTRILELKRSLIIPSSAQDKVSEAYQLAKNGYDQEVEDLLIEAIRRCQRHIVDTTRDVAELIYAAKSTVICVSVEFYDSLDKINQSFLYYRVQSQRQLSPRMPNVHRAFIKLDGSNVSEFYLLYDSSGLDELSQQFQKVEKMTRDLLHVVEHGELKIETD